MRFDEMTEWNFIWGRMIKVAVEAPWWKTMLVGLGLALLSLAGPGVIAVLGRKENVLLNVLAALWWLPLLLLGFLSAIGFVRQVTKNPSGRLTKPPPLTPQHRRGAEPNRKTTQGTAGGFSKCTSPDPKVTAGSKRGEGRQSAPLRKAK